MTVSRAFTIENVKGLRETRLALGTVVTIFLPGAEAKGGSAFLKEAFEEINRIERLLSVFVTGSDIWRLNHSGYCKEANPETVEVIRRARFHSELSGGIFDITARSRELTDDFTVGNRTSASWGDYRNVVIENNTIRFTEGEIKVNLGAIGKGYAVDRALACLEKRGIKSAMVNAGGDLRVIGEISNGQFWRVGIRNPFKRKEMIANILLYNQAVATSGSYQRSVHDIFDPRSGKGSKGVFSASVVACTAIDADALATSAFVLGPEKGQELIENWTGGAALWVLPDGSIIHTPRWKEMNSIKG